MRFNSVPYGFVLEKAFMASPIAPVGRQGAAGMVCCSFSIIPHRADRWSGRRHFIGRCSPQASSYIAVVMCSIGANDGVPSLPENVAQ